MLRCTCLLLAKNHHLRIYSYSMFELADAESACIKVDNTKGKVQQIFRMVCQVITQEINSAKTIMEWWCSNIVLFQYTIWSCDLCLYDDFLLFAL